MNVLIRYTVFILTWDTINDISRFTLVGSPRPGPSNVDVDSEEEKEDDAQSLFKFITVFVMYPTLLSLYPTLLSFVSMGCPRNSGCSIPANFPGLADMDDNSSSTVKFHLPEPSQQRTPAAVSKLLVYRVRISLCSWWFTSRVQRQQLRR